MAFIDKWEKEDKKFRKQVNAETKYSVSDEYGERLFQISTYGSVNRKAKGVASQTIQFNKKAAIELIAILKNEFVL